MRQRSPRQETSSRGADDFDDDGCRWCICGFRSFLLASAEMASNASSSRKEGRAPCSFKSLEGRSSKATGPSTTTTATEDRSLSLSLSLPNKRAPCRPRTPSRNRELLPREHARRRAMTILGRRQSDKKSMGKSRARGEGRRGQRHRLACKERERARNQNASLSGKASFRPSLSRV